MSKYIVTLKQDASDQDVAGIKQSIIESGGKITTEYELIKGFVAELPVTHDVQSLAANAHVLNVEPDQEVHIAQ